MCHYFIFTTFIDLRVECKKDETRTWKNDKGNYQLYKITVKNR
ncbi:hypothetical protein SBF1_5190002 [Candidatus Desulfosporosinus infrequens]|uniref:Uncharacterized protein n=1 Tax=Candidatus Desulfosporosinus infrequens TaxID=2043169 RepID=A0A2U3LI17_9FIRM|nr:hypothetical protein SBF1_5190002 [Candidatus Desulfosporosinus infrequens]